MTRPWHGLLATALLAASPSAAVAAPPSRTVRVALDPGQYRVLSHEAMPARQASLAHGYARLVSARTGLQFDEHIEPSSQAAMRALCEDRADLMVMVGLPDHPPCALAASPAYYRGEALLASRHARVAQVVLDDGASHRIAVVRGSHYSAWLATHYPQLQVIAVADLPDALSAVETGVTDAALGLDVLMRPLVRREFADSLLLRRAPEDLPSTVHLVARGTDDGMIEEIDAAMQAITPQQHAQVLQQLARHTYFSMPPLAVLVHHFRWQVMALGAMLSLLLAATFWLIRAHQSAQRSARRQSRFIGVMSHEVRNAAQALVASVDLLSQSGLDAGQRQLVNAARAAGTGLRQLLGHALDYSRMAAGQFRPNPGWHDVQQLASDCIAALRPSAEAKGLRLGLQVTPAPLPLLWVDPAALRQILSNLLGNALKFTPQGGIEVAVSVRPHAEGADLQLIVSDTGIGIPAEHQAGVFQPFAQVHARDNQGAGLGLSICRDLVAALHGRIRLHSAPGQGSRFEIHLPTSTLPPAAPDPATPLAGRSVLLVEDHALNRAIVARQLGALGAVVQTCTDGDGALQAQQDASSAVVLIDCDLPDMSGYQLAAALRRQEQAHHRSPALLVALSGASSAAHVQRCRASGMDAVLYKPLDTAQLLAVLGADRIQPPDQTAPLASTDPLWAPCLQAVQEELLALQDARRHRQADALRHHAHRLDGVLRVLGRAALADTAADLHELTLHDAADWHDADRLLDHLYAQAGALVDRRPT
ncbi:response regulator [Bacillus subtilis subsp. subtilis]|nr:response regulator [Bacillus subtilis subsp. subtilis]